MTTQIFLFHPGFTPLRTNAAMAAAAATLPDVAVHNVYAAYPDGQINVACEIERLVEADRVVFQFPIHWYSTPSLMKEWQDRVLTQMFYIEPRTGAKLAGKPVMVAASVGNVRSAYGPGGVNLFPLEEMLKPLRATANRCGLKWSAPFLVYRADRLSDDQLAGVADEYRSCLKTWRSQSGAAAEVSRVA